MATENVKILHIEDLISAISNTQIAIEPANDSDLGFRMWGGKDGAGTVTKWLAKDQDAFIKALRLTGSATTTAIGLLRHDANGDVDGGLMTVAEFNTYLSDGPIGAGAHNSTTGIQGGIATEYYHLSSAEWSGLRGGTATVLHKHDISVITGATANYILFGGASSLDESSDLTWDDTNKYFHATGRMLGTKGSDVASATDITLGAGNFFDITGTTDIERILGTGWTAGSQVRLQFDSALTIKHGIAAGGGYYGFNLKGAVDADMDAGQCMCFCFDGAWWRDLSSDGARQGEMTAYSLGTALGIASANVYHGVYGLSAGTLSGWTFDAGRVVDSNIVNEIDGSPQLRIETSATHGLTTGDIVTLSGMNNSGHDGPTAITVISTTIFSCDDIAYVAGAGSSSGAVVEPAYLEADSTAGGSYLCNMSVSGQSAVSTKTYKFEMFINATDQDTIVAEITPGSTATASGSSAGFLTIAEGDRVWLAVEGQTDGTDFTVEHVNVNLHRI